MPGLLIESPLLIRSNASRAMASLASSSSSMLLPLSELKQPCCKLSRLISVEHKAGYIAVSDHCDTARGFTAIGQHFGAKCSAAAACGFLWALATHQSIPSLSPQ